MSTTADQVPVGQAFVGTMWKDEFSAARDKRKVPGKEVRVTLIVMHGIESAKTVMELMSRLPHDHTDQISSDLATWVAGARSKRSKYVRLVDWAMRSHESRTVEVRQ